MNNLQKFSATLLLIGTLSLSTSAGQIEIGSPQPAPPPPPADGGTSATVNGNMHTGNSDEAKVVAEAALSLLQGVLALL